MKRVFLAGAALLLSASALADECDNATTQRMRCAYPA